MIQLLQGDCLEVMKGLADNSIDLTVTSPPYDNLRTYNGNTTFNFEGIASELFRITKEGGVLVWVIGDATINGDETGTSFKHALYFKSIGFKLYDTMIYEKSGVTPTKNRYYPAFEYMFVFSKGKPKTFNPIMDRENKWRERWGKTRIRRKPDGSNGTPYESKIAPEFGMRRNIWKYTQGGGYGADDSIAYKHPAIFPEKLATDHILSWSNEGETVLDCFAGSGTTGVACLNTGRHCILIERQEIYCAIINQRLNLIEELDESEDWA